MVHTNSDSAKREKETVTFTIRVRTMWYEEKVSNFEIAVAKLKETLRNVKFVGFRPDPVPRSLGTIPRDRGFRDGFPRDKRDNLSNLII